MKKSVIYIHGKGGTPKECEHYRTLFDGFDIIGFEYKAQTPWEAKNEFAELFDTYSKDYEYIILIANSIGAFLALYSLADKPIDKALLISPVADMELLIKNMMRMSGIDEEELSDKGEITTDFGETLSWRYLCFVRENPIAWHIPTYILYGENDDLTSEAAITAFATRVNARLTVMKNGEHWFHTEKQMKFLDDWIKNCLS